MKVATFNVNSIRKRLSVVKRWLKTHAPDVLCLQETKVQDSEFPLQAFAATGYHVRFCGMKGYNGVALFTRREPEWVSFGLSKGPDGDGPRLLHAVVDGVSTIPNINTNWSGSSGCAGISAVTCLRMNPRSGVGT